MNAARGHVCALLAFVASAWSSPGCASVGEAPPDLGLEALALSGVGPREVVPGTVLLATGASFVDAAWGQATLEVKVGKVALSLPATYVSDKVLAIPTADALLETLGEGTHAASVSVAVLSTEDGRVYRSRSLEVTFEVAATLTPAVYTVDEPGVAYVNDDLALAVSGVLLDPAEGVTTALVAGCLVPAGEDSCQSGPALELPVVPASSLARDAAAVRLGPALVGLAPGTWRGELVLQNLHASGQATSSAVVAFVVHLGAPEVLNVATASATLGQYVDVEGGGFLGGEPAQFTELQVVGEFEDAATGETVDVIATLVPRFASGRRVRYVVDEADALGALFDLRQVRGELRGTLRPVVTYDGQTVGGVARSFALVLAPVRQVVFLDFTDSYREALRAFGLRALADEVIERAVAAAAEAYPGVGVEFRLAEPADMALYSHVEIVGPDPNGLGLLGYDNSPGKDVGNARLYDYLGGANALTQADGAPGYGGVFIDSLMAFSQHPLDGSASQGASAVFDELFDPLRPDRGHAARLSEAAAFAPLAAGEACPGVDRQAQLACAVWAMGNLIGGTLAHEVGHSLGLANPYGEGFHNPGDQPNRLMDGGAARGFAERAQIAGHGPGVFCDQEYAYLRQILPSTAPADSTHRPSCQ